MADGRKTIRFTLNGRRGNGRRRGAREPHRGAAARFRAARRARQLRRRACAAAARSRSTASRRRAACFSRRSPTAATIETVEGLADGDTLDPIQTAFLENAAFQCGFCTPGFIMMTRELLDRIPDPSDDDIRHYLSGNLCRCAAYPEIITAVRSAARERITTKA